MSDQATKPAAIVFVILGIFVIAFEAYAYSQVPWDALANLHLDAQIVSLQASFLIGISLGLTEFAVAWLIQNHKEEKPHEWFQEQKERPPDGEKYRF